MQSITIGKFTREVGTQAISLARKLPSPMKRPLKYSLQKLGYRQAVPAKEPLPVFKVFRGTDGNEFELFRGYRKRIWPKTWDEMLRGRQEPSLDTVMRLRYLDQGRDQAAEMAAFLAKSGVSISGKDTLEVGCLNGATCFALAELGARRVWGLDVPANFVTSKQVTDEAIEYWSDYLTTFRKNVGTAFDREANSEVSAKVRFRDQSISDLTDVERFDVIMSWNTLEHVLDPAAAFRAMYRALRPGGFACHRYHPFFCESGAHFDTLDFHWGHVRLAPNDFERYIREVHPDELQIADYRFNRTLNRMTMADLKDTVRNAGFEMRVFRPITDSTKRIARKVMAQCKANYPSLSMADLLTCCVWFLLKKPN